MYRKFIYMIIAVTLILPFTAAAGEVPDAAEQMAEEIDNQVLRHMGEEPNRGAVTIAITVPVTLDRLDVSSQLGRQMAEEMTQSLAKLGYSVLEIRKAQVIRMVQPTGETMLTRDVTQLARQTADAVAVLTGTYVITSDNVRFNMKLLRAVNNEVLGASSATITITTEVASLLPPQPRIAIAPSVLTRLP